MPTKERSHKRNGREYFPALPTGVRLPCNSEGKSNVYTPPASNKPYLIFFQAVEHISLEQQSLIVGELEPRILECVRDSNGNHVRTLSNDSQFDAVKDVHHRSFKG